MAWLQEEPLNRQCVDQIATRAICGPAHLQSSPALPGHHQPPDFGTVQDLRGTTFPSTRRHKCPLLPLLSRAQLVDTPFSEKLALDARHFGLCVWLQEPAPAAAPAMQVDSPCLLSMQRIPYFAKNGWNVKPQIEGHITTAQG